LKSRAAYRRPEVQTVPAAEAVLLACTGRFNCEPIVGFPCCKPNANACNGCKP
jgi:hypothetical protein